MQLQNMAGRWTVREWGAELSAPEGRDAGQDNCVHTYVQPLYSGCWSSQPLLPRDGCFSALSSSVALRGFPDIRAQRTTRIGQPTRGWQFAVQVAACVLPWSGPGALMMGAEGRGPGARGRRRRQLGSGRCRASGAAAAVHPLAGA